MHTIGFPGLGIGDFTINDVAFTLFGIDVAWYGVIIVCAMILTVIYIYFRSKRSGLIIDDLIDIAFAGILPGIIGARLYYVFFDHLKNPSHYITFKEIINIRSGGLAIYGGLIFGAVGVYTMLKIKKIHVLKFFDILAPGVMIAQAIGRWGNFFNAEAYGAETTLPWRMRIVYGSSNIIEVHPTFLYESLWNVVGFLLINLVVLKHKKYDGQSLLSYLAWYGFGRMIIEGLRQDSLYIGNTGIRISQALSFLLFVASSILMIYFAMSKNKPPKYECIYFEGSKGYDRYAKSQESSVSENGQDSGTEETSEINSYDQDNEIDIENVSEEANNDYDEIENESEDIIEGTDKSDNESDEIEETENPEDENGKNN